MRELFKIYVERCGGRWEASYPSETGRKIFADSDRSAAIRKAKIASGYYSFQIIDIDVESNRRDSLRG